MILRFGNFLSPGTAEFYRATVDWLAQQVGARGLLVEGRSFGALERGELEGGFICGLPYVELADGLRPAIALLGAPVLAHPRYQGRPIYFSDVVVRRESGVAGFAELRGCRWSFNDPTSHSGYSVVRHELLRLGLDDRFFGDVVEAGSHLRSIDLLLEGRVDASAIDSHVLELAVAERPELERRLRRIHVMGPSTIQPVVLSARVPHPLRQQLSWALRACNAAVVPALRRFGVARWATVEPSDYDDIRRMRSAIAESGRPALGQRLVALSPWAPAHRDLGTRIGGTDEIAAA